MKPPLSKPLKKTSLTVLCVLCVLCCALSVLGLPMTNQWLSGLGSESALSSVSAYLQGTTGVPSTIRVADQLDSLRAEPSKISKQDEQIAAFLAKKYRLAASEVAKYVHFANLAAKAKGLDASLVLAVMSIESNLNSITESSAGAQGLMQVLTEVHIDKFVTHGGEHKAFDPEANIIVGTSILADCIKLGGSVEMGLKCYVGATGPTDGGYGAKVLAEKERIEKARSGVFDFSSNNKVLQDLGILAAPSVDVVGSSAQIVDLSQLTKVTIAPATGANQVHPNTVNATSNTTVPAPHSSALPSVLPSPLPVTLPTAPVAPAPLYSVNVDSHASSNVNVNGASSKQK
jgi:Transglycosylase SLT domain